RVEIRIAVLTLEAGKFRKLSLVNWNEKTRRTDGVLLVGGNKFFVSRQTLSMQSNFFKKLFFGGANDTAHSEVELENVNANDLTLLLNILHRMAPVTLHKAEILLELAHRFGCSMLLDDLENILADEFSYEEDEEIILRNLCWSNKYGLHFLKHQYMSGDFTVETLTKMKRSKYWKDLDEATARELVNALFKERQFEDDSEEEEK
ncbi:hypothetical protein PFISCL1PPCAC_19037, partial [Pristionchus fissidentatus]